MVRPRPIRIRINRQIRADRVRVVDEEGKQIGILPLSEALGIARERELDLVEISPTAKPPVCKVMDYGKYKYKQKKKAHESKKQQKQIQIKEIKVKPKIDKHDIGFKTRHIKKFLSDGNKVKVTVVFRGREMSYPELGQKLLIKIRDEVNELANVEVAPKREGRTMSMLLNPVREGKGGKKEVRNGEGASRRKGEGHQESDIGNQEKKTETNNE